MHLILAMLFVVATWRWGDWRNWQKYHATMLFIIMGSLLYDFLYAGQLLWEIKPDLYWSYKFTVLMHSFISLPLTTLVFLTNFPKEFNKQLLRILMFIGIYGCLELIMFKLGGIQYHHGWNFWWSIAWDCMMFPVLALHFKKPIISYFVSLVVFVTMVTLFPVF
ncbi:MAG: CBO0543 family protein [Bacillota bacterium]|nr:CBO0543 family protein [Bacillota bacterium]